MKPSGTDAQVDRDSREVMVAGKRSTRVALACGGFAMVGTVAMGCSGSDANAPTRTAPTVASTSTARPAPEFAAQVTQLCTELQPKVLQIYGGGGHPAPYPIRVFKAEQPRLTSLYQAFDARVDAIPVTDADRRAVAAFKAYRHLSDGATARMSAAAETGRQSTFD